MRITNGMIFNNSLNFMQSSLGALVESNIQGGTQKQVNRPSDNPASAALILNTRNEIENTLQYERNLDTARGWVEMSLSTYQQTSTAIIAIKELALQASTGHLSEENRESISYELDQLMGQILNLSNTEYAGNSIFGGHNYTESAYDMGLSASTKDENIDTNLIRVTGSSEETIAIRFLKDEDGGQVTTKDELGNEVSYDAVIGENPLIDDPASTTIPPAQIPSPIYYEWSNDGGATWQQGTLAGDETSIAVGGAVVEFQSGTPITFPEDVDNRNSEDGTFIYLHPTAIYNGDDNDASAYATASYGNTATNTLPIEQMDMTVLGTVSSNVSIKILGSSDGNTPPTYTDSNLGAGGNVSYLVSTDGGKTYGTTVHSVNIPNPATSSIILPFSDGVTDSTIEIDLSQAQTRDTTTVPHIISGITTLSQNMEINIQPRRVDITGNATIELATGTSENAEILANAQGVFGQNTLVRLDSEVDLLATPGTEEARVAYSYSTDGGRTWIATETQLNGEDYLRLSIPGGYVDVRAEIEVTPPATPLQTSKTLSAGAQFTVHPDRADLEFEIMEDTYVDVNQVGKDVFGGNYQGTTVEGPNLFDTIGKLIAYCEFNDVDGISKMYAELTNVQEHVLVEAARVGGIENRLDLADDVLSATKLDMQSRLSYAEDIDLTTLMNNLAKQELTYTTVLQSTSQILQLNLMQYL